MGGAAQGGRPGRPVSEINVTPLVDVMMVLLVIFMVTATFLARGAFDAKLPEAAHGLPLDQAPLVVEVLADGTIRIEGERVDVPGLKEAARRSVEAGDEGARRAIVAADYRVIYGRVVEVIDTLRGAGVAGFALEIRPRANTERSGAGG